MSRHRSGFMYFLNIVVITGLLVGPLLPLRGTAVAASNTEETLAPSEAELNLPYPSIPQNELVSPFVDPTELTMQQLLGDELYAELWGGVAQLEPFGARNTHRPDPTASMQTVLPSAPLPEVASPLTAQNLNMPQPQGLTAYTNGSNEKLTPTEVSEQNELPDYFFNPALFSLSKTTVQQDEAFFLAGLSSSNVKKSDTLSFLLDQTYTVYLPLILHPSGTLIPAKTGGEVSLPGGNVTLVFQPEGLPESILANIHDANPTGLHSNFALMGPSFDVQANWVSDGEPVTQLDLDNQPVKPADAAKPTPVVSKYWAAVQISLTKAQAENENLTIARLDVHSGKWEILPTQIMTQTAVAQTDRLGKFALIENMAQWNDSHQPLGIGDEIIVDDGDSGFQLFEHDGSVDYFWSSDCGTGSCVQGDALWTYNRSPFEPLPPDQPWNWATWTPSMTEVGYYYISAWIPGDHATTAGATYKIVHAGQEDFVSVNQAVVSGDWVSLGAFEFAAGGGEYIYLDDVVPERDEYPHGNWSWIGYDAIKFVYAGTEPPPPVDTEPPVINLRTWEGHDGQVLIQAYVTDNVAVAEVTLIVNGAAMAMTAVGNDLYELVVPLPPNEIHDYQIVAVDTNYNVATFPPGSTFQLRGYLSRNLGSYNSACNKCDPGTQGDVADPVNTANGNFVYHTVDSAVAGLGDTDILIERTYNSLPDKPQGIISYTLDADNNLVEMPFYVHPTPFGFGWTFPFDVHLLIVDNLLLQGVQVRYADGHTADFTDNGDGTYSPQEPRIYDELTLDGDGYILKQKNLTEYHFDSDGYLQSTVDRNGNALSLTYSDNQVTAVTNGSGRTVTFTYDGAFITDVHGPEGRHLQYAYEDGRLRYFTDGNGHTTEYVYNADGRLTAVITPEGHPALRLQYNDPLGRATQEIVGAAEIYNFAYDDDSHITTTTDTYGRKTTHVYDDEYRLVTSIDDASYAEQYDYDQNDHRNYFMDREGREWFYSYDEHGNRLTEDGPLGWHQEWTYNDLNRVTSQITQIDDAHSRETTFDYDDKGNLTDITNALSHSSHIDYDARGLPTHVFDFNGNETINTYDPVTGDLVMTRNGAGDEVEYAYDGLGRMVEMMDGNDNLYTYTYDDADNLTDIDGPLGYHLGYRYDVNDNLHLEIDANGGETEYWYDASEQVTRIENQLDFATLFAYDDMDNLVRMEDAEGRVWTYEYDVVYNQTAVHGPEDTHTFYIYNGVRAVTSMTECNSALVGDICPDNRVTTYAYNDLNQLVQVVENFVDGMGETADINVTSEFSYDLVGNLLVFTDALDNETHYQYDLLDQLLRAEDAEAQVTEYAYDGNGNLIWLQNPREKETVFSYDGANRLETMTDAAGELWQYAYDGNGNLTDETDPLNVVTHYDYDELDRVRQLVQNFGAGDGETADTNVTTRFAYDLAGNLRFIYDPRGSYVTEHRYDAAHRRILTIDNEGGQTVYDYDRVNNLTGVTDGNDHQTTFVYDGLNRQTAITNPEGHAVQFAYDRLGNTLVITDARGYLTTFTYDGMNRVVLMVDALKGEWLYDYDAMGNVLCETDANGHANDCYTYDDVYRALTVTDAAGYIDSFSYDENGNRLTWTDGNGHTTAYTYDNLDRLATLTNAEAETTTYQYDPLGNQTFLIEADGIVTRYGYDPLYRLVTVNQNDQPGKPESADVNVDTHYVYDEVGNLLTIIDAEQHETHFTYDGMNRLQTEVDADHNLWQYGYDPVGNRIWRIDANGSRTNYAYYPDNQPQTISYELDGSTVAYIYDENNNQTEMGDHLGTTTWVYDPLNRVTDVTDAFGRVLAYGYDAVGNRISLQYNDGRIVQYTYYDNDWLQTVVDPEEHVTSYDRDGVGLVITATNPNETISISTYDKANRLLTLVNEQTTGAQTTNSAFTYTYNEVGHRTEMVAEYGWRNPAVVTSTYTYDGLRRLIRDEDSEGLWTDYTFDRVGNRLTLDTNDDSLSPRPFDEKTVYYSYSDANRLLSLVGNTHPGSPGVKREDNVCQTIYAFRHEVEAQRGIHIHELTATTLLVMADDLIARLEGHPTPDEGEVTAAIEAIRVQVLSDWAGGLIDSSGIAHSLLVKLDLGDAANDNGANDEWQTQTFTYDANGNRINTEYPGPQGSRVQGTDYIYDPENRLIVNWDYQMNLQGNRVDRAITTMEYDGGGRRLAKTYDPNEGGGGAKRVEYVFDGWDPVAEYNQWNPQYENFYRGDMNRIITLHHFPSGTEGQMYWYHYDGLGSVSGLTKQHGQSSHNYRYEPYGQIEMPPGNFTDPHNHYTFTGQEWDENMGLYEFYARKYDPVVGMWLSQDSYRGETKVPSTLHRYQYVLDNPVNYVDPYGYYVICFQQGFSEKEHQGGFYQMCRSLAQDGHFGDSKEFEMVTNDAQGRKDALEKLRDFQDKYPDEELSLMGFSYGGSGALEFAWLLQDWGGMCSEYGDIPYSKIQTMILIDPVTQHKQNVFNRTIYDYDNMEIRVPSNVSRAINLYATEDLVSFGEAMGIVGIIGAVAEYKWNAFDNGIHNIPGAENYAVEGTNHCTITEICIGDTLPLNTLNNLNSPELNQDTLNMIEELLDDGRFSGGGGGGGGGGGAW